MFKKVNFDTLLDNLTQRYKYISAPCDVCKLLKFAKINLRDAYFNKKVDEEMYILIVAMLYEIALRDKIESSKGNYE